MRKFNLGALAFVCCLAGSAGTSHALEKRPMADYDGRGSPPQSAGDTLLWVPRLVLSPLYLTSEYVIRRPLGALVTTAERNNWATFFIDLFTFDKEHHVGLVPTAFLDFGFRPSVGLYFFWDRFLAQTNDLRIHGSTGGSDWFAAAAVDRIHFGANASLTLAAGWTHRPDFVYFGDGPRTVEANRSRYGADIFDAGPTYELRPFPGLALRTKAGFRDLSFRDGSYGGDPTVASESKRGGFSLPAGYREGIAVGYEELGAALDSRPIHATSGTGLRLSGRVEHETDVKGVRAHSWLRYGGTLGGFLDVSHHRVVSLVTDVAFADPLRGGDIPFPESVVLGGAGAMAGFLPGRLVGRSAATASLRYEWPIWVWLDGTMQFAAGNVFGAGLEDFAPKLLRLSSGLGIRTSNTPDQSFELLVGFGTETFEHGTQVTSFRLAVGGTDGF